jgi:alpha-mannosidase
VDLPYSDSDPVHVVDLKAGAEVPSQFVIIKTEDGGTHRCLRILASAIPSVGYKVYEIRSGKGITFPKALRAEGDVLENTRYRIRVNGGGAIASLLSTKLGGSELAGRIDGRQINDLGSASGALRITNAGPVSVTVEASASGPVPHTSEITLFRESDRIDIRNEITANFSTVESWAFTFNLHSPDVWHEEVGAVNHARIAPDGDYAKRFSRLDWLTLNHFVSMNGDDGIGVTLSNADCAFMKLGRSKIADGVSQLDTSTPQLRVLAGGQIDGPKLGIPAQGGDTYFLQRFALCVDRRRDAASSMRFAMEHQNPLIAGHVDGGTSYPEKSFSFLTISDPNLVLWALKPSEEGIRRGVIARVWNLNAHPSRFAIGVEGGLSAAWNTTHIETNLDKADIDSGGLEAAVASWQIRTFRLLPQAKPRVVGHQD